MGVHRWFKASAEITLAKRKPGRKRCDFDTMECRVYTRWGAVGPDLLPAVVRALRTRYAAPSLEGKIAVKLQMNARDNIRSFFTTPVAQFVLPNAAIINPGLSHFLLEMEQRAGAKQRPLLEGWHSDHDLAEANHPDVMELMDSARSAVFSLLGILTHVTRFQAQLNLSAWASIYRARTFSRAEVHTGSSWSGMYFVRAAKLDAERSALAGRLSFHDPRNRAAAVDLPGLCYKNTFEVKPRDGLMVIYPSWLQCHLNPFESDSVTALIAFTSRITGFQSLE